MVLPLSVSETSLLHMDDPTHLMMVTAVLWFDEPADWDTLATTLVGRLLQRYPRFSQRIVEPGAGLLPMVAGWQDVDVDPAAHISRLRLPAPGDRAALAELAGNLMSTPLDMRVPPWHLHLVDGYNEGGRRGCAIIARLHHAIADGMALAGVLLSLTDEASARSGAHPDPAAETGSLGLARRVAGRGWRAGTGLVRHPGSALRVSGDALGLGTTLGRLLLLPDDPPTVFRGPLRTVKRASWSPPAPLAEVKALARATGGSVNDVLLAVAAGALRAYSLGRGQAPSDVRAFVPVNLRPEPGAAPPGLGNHFGLVVVPLPVATASPVARVHAVRASMARLKAGQQSLVAYGLVGALGALPAPVAEVLAQRLGRKGSLVMTNVPGPPTRLHLSGTPIAGILFWVPQTGEVALGLSIFSYAGTVTVGVAADAAVVPDPQTISETLGQGLAELRSALTLESPAKKGVPADVDIAAAEGVDAGVPR